MTVSYTHLDVYKRQAMVFPESLVHLQRSHHAPGGALYHSRWFPCLYLHACPCVLQEDLSCHSHEIPLSAQALSPDVYKRPVSLLCEQAEFLQFTLSFLSFFLLE